MALLLAGYLLVTSDFHLLIAISHGDKHYTHTAYVFNTPDTITDVTFVLLDPPKVLVAYGSGIGLGASASSGHYTSFLGRLQRVQTTEACFLCFSTSLGAIV